MSGSDLLDQWGQGCLDTASSVRVTLTNINQGVRNYSHWTPRRLMTVLQTPWKVFLLYIERQLWMIGHLFTIRYSSTLFPSMFPFRIFQTTSHLCHLQSVRQRIQESTLQDNTCYKYAALNLPGSSPTLINNGQVYIGVVSKGNMSGRQELLDSNSETISDVLKAIFFDIIKFK